jgi:plastocyanin
MTRSRLLASIALCSALVLGAAACGDDSETSSTTTAPAAGGDETTTTAGGGDGGGSGLEITDFTFADDLTVEAGAEVEVSNNDSVPHTVTADDGDFDTGQIAGGETSSFTAPDEPGDYAYHCEVHQNMTATLTVT